MREIKFKFEHLGEIFDVYEINFETQKVILDNGDIFEISQGTLLQYSGKKDKNGKEIYEKHIVKKKDTSKCPKCGYDYESIGEIIFDKESLSFCFKNSDGCSHLSFYDSDELEILGDSFNNAYLLKK